jgi:hypothetical protein
MATKLTTLTHKIAIQLHLVAESCTICNSSSERPVQKLLETLSYSNMFPSTARSSEWSLVFRFSNQYTVRVSNVSHACYTPCSSHPPSLDHPNNIWWSLQVMKLLIMQSSPFSRHFLPLRYKHPHLPVLKHPQCTFFTQCKRPSFTPIENNR